jgi:hypothetical protein
MPTLSSSLQGKSAWAQRRNDGALAIFHSSTVNARAVEAAMSFYPKPDGNMQKKETKQRKAKKK